MSTVGFWDSVQSKSNGCSLPNAVESYFYLDGISGRLGGKKLEVLKNSTDKVRVSKPELMNFAKWAMTAIKIISYCTIVIPLIALGLKAMYRCSHAYTLVVKRPAPSPAPAQPQRQRQRQAPPPAKPQPQRPAPSPAPAPVAPEPQSPPTPTETTYKVATWNILAPQGCLDAAKPPMFPTTMGYHTLEEGEAYPRPNTDVRREKIIANIEAVAADILCVQELEENENNKMMGPRLYQYDREAAVHQNNRGRSRDQGVAVFWKKHKFTCLNRKVLKGKFNTIDGNDPTKDREAPRAAVMVDLLDRTAKKVIRVVSVHAFDPNSFRSDRGQYVRWVAEQVEKEPALTVKGEQYTIDCKIIAGDMNQDEFGDRDSKEYSGDIVTPSTLQPNDSSAVAQEFRKAGYDHTDEDTASTEFYKNLNNGDIVDKRRKIDWIYLKGPKIEIIPIVHSGLHEDASDHRLVQCNVII